ncbi:MAG TPA: TFIIB-type zinc ribbon-containing protein [candidate division Zixibacteria bacterium]|nr:TFIIB-type zinc ribbon-containing protein [candidate division Zixibacteria bacterium]
MPPRCPNCKGKMDHEPPNYVCRACGLVVNRYDFDKTKREHFGTSRNDDDPDHEHKKRNRDYLDWYLSSDKDDIDED